MKRFFFIPIIVLGIGCSGSDSPKYEKYTPKYEGQYVNSEKILQALYPIPKEFSRDSVMNWAGVKYLGKDFSVLSGIKADSGKLQIIPEINNSTSGLDIYIINTSSDTIVDDLVQDGCIMMVQQAKDPFGHWKSIESWAGSSCGLSYMYYLALPPNSYISISAPRYKGEYRTEIRFLLFYRSSKSIYSKIYSRIFWGSVNLSQFERPGEVPSYIFFLE